MKNRKRISLVLYLEDGDEIDLDVPCEITVEELLKGLNAKLDWKMKQEELAHAYFRSENPVAFLKGNHSLEEYQLRDGSALFFSFPE